jgi:hypothetical protein
MINRRPKNLEGQAHGEVDSSTALNETMGLFSPPKEDEMHGYDPTLEARYDTSGGEPSDDVALTLSNGVTYEGDMGESGCSDNDDVLSMEMRDSTICEMSESTICEVSESTICEISESTICDMSESTICESKCFHFEGMSDTPSAMRVVVDRSSKAILISNNSRSTSSVFSHVAIGSMDDETPILEKMYMLHTHDETTPCLETMSTSATWSHLLPQHLPQWSATTKVTI